METDSSADEKNIPEAEIIAGFYTLKLEEEKDSEEVIYRVGIKNESEANDWLEEFSTLTRSSWIVCQTYPNAKRYSTHK